MDLGTPIGDTFRDFFFVYVSVIWSVKKPTCIAVMKFDDLLVENVMVYDVPTSQICDKYNVFIRFDFFVFFMNLMVPGTSLELIWRSLEVSRHHLDDF